LASSGPNKKVANGLVAMSSAAVLAVYSAGYVRTRAAADRLAHHSQERRTSRTHPTEVPAAQVLPAAVAMPAPKPSDAVETKPEKPSLAKSSAPKEAPVPQPAAPAAVAVPVAAVPEVPVAPPPVVAATVTPTPPLPPPAPEKPPESPKPVYRDGKYTAWGSCRHGDIEATVIIEGGLIKSATISECQTRYSCSVIDKLPPLVAKTQKAGTDWVSGATESSDAFDFAVGDALAKAK
jgi:uncharacterized protein with FMN-binding domain